MRKPSQDIVLQEFKIKEPAKLLPFLIEKKVRKSRNAVKSLLAHKQIKVNDKLTTQFDLDLKTGDVVAVMKFNQARKRNKLKGLSIVFEDEYLIVIEKDAGMLSVGTDKEKTLTIFNVLNQHVKAKDKDAERIFVLHRLDREVSGLMVFAKDMETQSMFQKNWNSLVPHQTFTGILEGSLSPAEGTIKSWLTENKNFMVFSSSSDNGGLEAVTSYKTEQVNNKYSQVVFKMQTRRKNQVRAQMNQLKHPIVGDRKYGAPNNPIKRIALHASELTVTHPATGQKLEFKCVLPKAMQQLMNPKQG